MPSEEIFITVTLNHTQWTTLWQLSGYLQGHSDREGIAGKAARHYETLLAEILPGRFPC